MEKFWARLLRFSWLIILALVILTVFFALQFRKDFSCRDGRKLR
ncbi:MAG: hypothetical protein ACUVV5_02175 [Candidatus Aminicenantales bacterium]